MKQKLSEWAKDNGVHPKTAYRWYRNGTMPYPTTMIGPKTIIVEVPETEQELKTVIYARVSSSDQKEDLERQANRLLEYAAYNGVKITRVEKEIASGLNDKRPKLNRILKDPTIENIIVEHRDRIARHNVTPIISALSANGRKITIVDNTEIDDDLVADVLSLLTSYSARLYGRRSARNRAKETLSHLEKESINEC